MPAEDPISLTSLVANNMRGIRMSRALLQEDIATAARWVGLKWSSVTVAQIESQSRQLNLDEFLLLPLVLKCSLKDLLRTSPVDRLITLGFDTMLPADVVLSLASEEGPNSSEEMVPMVPGLEVNLDPRIRAAVWQAGLTPTLLTYLKIREGARGEAERKAAQTLKIAAVTLTAHALRLWGRSLTEERDARAQEQAVKGKEVRAVRGHITRSLLQDLHNQHHMRVEAQTDETDIPAQLEPTSADEKALQNITLESYAGDPKVRKAAHKPYERWMRSQIAAALNKGATSG